VKLILILIIGFIINAQDIRLVASTSNLAAVAKAIGQEHVKIDVIVRAQQNPHTIQVLPSYMLKISRADIYLKVGLSLDYWSQQLIDGARNNSLIVLDCSKGIETINKPKGPIDPSKGHMHPLGNPHYMLDPNRVKIAARNIHDQLVHFDPHNQADYDHNYDEFIKELDNLITTYSNYLIGAKFISYHSTFNYLVEFAGVEVVGTIEPLPGVPPTPSHLRKLIDMIPEQGAKLIIQEDFYEKKSSRFLNENTGINYVVLSPFAKNVSDDGYVQFYHSIMKNLKDKL
jgi:zinc/manganese transport system substrate-binding protein